MKTLSALFLSLLLCIPLFAQDSTNVSIAGTLFAYDLDVSARAVAVRGSYAYIADNDLHVVDISNPASPVAVNRVTVGFRLNCVALHDDFAFVSGPNDNLEVFDISDPANPEWVGTCQDSHGTQAIFIHDGYLYATRSWNGLLCVYDMSTAVPTEVGVYDFDFGVKHTVVYDHYAFVAAEYSNGVRILDVADPSAITEVAVIDIEYARSCAVYGTYLYVGRGNYPGNYEIHTFDISDPLNPVQTGLLSTPRGPIKLRIFGDYLFVTDIGDNEDGFEILELSDPSEPTLLTDMVIGGSVWDIAVQGNELFVANYDAGLKVMDITNLSDPIEIGNLTVAPNVTRLDCDDTYAYLVSSRASLIVADYSDPQNPVAVGFCDLPDADFPDTFCIAVENGYAYVATEDSGLYIVSVLDPANPVTVAHVNGRYTHVDVENGYLYLADSIFDERIIIGDVSDPANPVLLAALPFGNNDEFYALKISGNLGFVAINETLRIYDVSDPAAPELLGHFHNYADEPAAIAVSGNIVIFAYEDAGFCVLDISDPASPVELSHIRSGSRLQDVDMVDNVLYVSRMNSGLKIYDLTDPARPLETGWYSADPYLYDICAVNSRYLCASNKNYMILYDALEATRSWIDITLTVDEPLLVPQGGSFTYGATLASNLPTTQIVDVWTDAYLPSGYLHRPIWVATDVEFTPSTVIENPSIVQTIPADAPVGMYTFRMKAGNYPGTKIGKDTFRFEVVPAVDTQGYIGWSSWGFSASVPTVKSSVVEASQLPLEYSVGSAYPNPFNPSTTVELSLPEAADLRVVVYNLAGQQVAEMANGQFAAGQHSLTFDGSNLAAGVYFVRANATEWSDTQKVLLLK